MGITASTNEAFDPNLDCTFGSASCHQTLAITDLNRTPIKSTLLVSPRVLIDVLAVVFPNLRDFDKVMTGCSFSEDDFDGGLFP